jgi:hypothetical protein
MLAASWRFSSCRDSFLDGAARDHADHGDGAILADAVGTVGGLILDGRVPPGVEGKTSPGPLLT